MTDREKLTTLIEESFADQHDRRRMLTVPDTVNYLIANGVVVREKGEKGEWVWDKRFSGYKCSICGGYDMGKSAFCRNCGADMRKGENG